MIFSERKDQLPGGLADKSKPSDFDSKQLAMGVEVEMEHTDDPDVALEIAMDHLKEDPRYYTKLKRVHKEGTMDIGYFVNLLEDLRYELEEAAPPMPHEKEKRKEAGMSALPTRKGRGGRMPAGMKSVKATGKTKGKLPGVAPHKPDETAQALAHIKKLNRTDMDKTVSNLKKLTRGGDPSTLESIAHEVRSIIERDERYGGGSPLNTREKAAKFGTPKWKSKLSAKMKAKHR